MSGSPSPDELEAMTGIPPTGECERCGQPDWLIEVTSTLLDGRTCTEKLCLDCVPFAGHKLYDDE